VGSKSWGDLSNSGNIVG